MYSKILVALDGSTDSLAGADMALALARRVGSSILAAHVYDARLHSRRFTEMEPHLPPPYQADKEMARVREAHKGLIFEGFEALSRGYMDRFDQSARAQGVPVEQIHREGRNYIKLLEIAGERHVNLIVLGAHGLADVKDGFLGSTASRLLRMAPCDILLARRASDKGKVIVGVDGSQEALNAAHKAATWARTFDTGLDLAAVYDPKFHVQVFKTMAESLSPSRQEEVGLATQQSLHDRLIDGGLEKLYEGFLNDAHARCAAMGMKAETKLLQGKPYRALVDYAVNGDADLIVAGRYGHHREDNVQIGSNSEALARTAKTNVLVVAPAESIRGVPSGKSISMEWDEGAKARLNRIPAFARTMAQQGIENHVRAKGGQRVTLDDFEEMARKLGMKDRGEMGHE